MEEKGVWSVEDGMWIGVRMLYLSPTDIARGAADAVKAERVAINSWNSVESSDWPVLQQAIRAALLRLLLAGNDWMKGSVEVKPGRLEIRIAVEMGHNEVDAAAVRRAVEVALADTKEGLQALAADLEGDDDAAIP